MYIHIAYSCITAAAYATMYIPAYHTAAALSILYRDPGTCCYEESRASGGT